MIEPIMYVGIGFLVAGLLVIGVIPLVHARAVRLTMRRLEALTPLSMAEIQADKDQLRAEFAMSTRRLEMSVEQMKAKTTSQLAEIGKKSEAIGRLKLELGEKTATLFALEAKEKQLGRRARARSRASSRPRTGALQETEARAGGARRPNSPRSAPIPAKTRSTSDSQRVELVAVRAQIEVLKDQVGELRERDQGPAGAPRAARPPRPRRRGNSSPRSAAGRPAAATASAISTVSSSRRPRKPKFSAAACRSWQPGSTSRAASWPTANTRPTACAAKRRARRRPRPTLRAELAEAGRPLPRLRPKP